MSIYLLDREQFIPCPMGELFDFFADAGNLESLTPPWLHFRILTAMPIVMQVNARIEYRIRWRGVPVHWLTEITDWEPPIRFVDQQLRGPYRLWHHTHHFAPSGDGTLMRDVVRYALPYYLVGHFMHALIVRSDLERIFDYRREKIARIFSQSAKNSPTGAGR
jgi:hypothetical protein